jgi:hypothetical protein
VRRLAAAGLLVLVLAAGALAVASRAHAPAHPRPARDIAVMQENKVTIEIQRKAH